MGIQQRIVVVGTGLGVPAELIHIPLRVNISAFVGEMVTIPCYFADLEIHYQEYGFAEVFP